MDCRRDDDESNGREERSREYSRRGRYDDRARDRSDYRGTSRRYDDDRRGRRDDDRGRGGLDRRRGDDDERRPEVAGSRKMRSDKREEFERRDTTHSRHSSHQYDSLRRRRLEKEEER